MIVSLQPVRLFVFFLMLAAPFASCGLVIDRAVGLSLGHRSASHGKQK